MEIIADYFLNNTVAWSNIITAVATAVLTHVFYRIRIRDERTSEFKKEMGREIAESLQAMNDFAVDVLQVEKYDIESIAKQGEIIHSDDLGWYPTIMESKDTFSDFLIKVGDCRRQYEKNLSNSVADLSV